MKLTLSQIVDAALLEQQGKIKTAAESGGASEPGRCSCGKPTMEGSKMCKACAEKAARREEDQAEAEGSEKTSSAYVEKLAGAVEHLLGNPSWLGSAGRVKIGQSQPAIAQASKTVGPGKGPNVLDTNVDKPTPGEQSTVVGQAKQQVPMHPSMESPDPKPKDPPNAMKDNIGEMKPAYPEEGVLKQGSVRARYMNAIMKNAADAENPAKITSPTSTVLPEDQTHPESLKRPAEVTSQESMIGSNQAAIDATKRQAKAVPKKRMAEVLTEPAQTKSTDKVLDENLGADKVNAAGAKIAMARTLLDKVASQGCSCSGEGTCGFCKIASRMRSKKSSFGLADGTGM